MKSILFIALITTLAVAQTIDLLSYPPTLQGYLDFMRDCGRQNYEQERFNAFVKTIQKLQELRKNGDKSNFGFCRWVDALPQQLNQTFSVKLPEGPADQFTRTNFKIGNLLGVGGGSMPNWRSSNKISSIKDQGSCGSCWAFTTTGLYESFMMVKGQKQYDLAEQFPLQCTTTLISNGKTSDCTGGYADYALQLVKQYGIPLQSEWPYKAASYGSIAGSPVSVGLCATSNASKFIKYDNLPGVKNTTFVKRYDNITVDQMQALLTEGPVGVLLYVDAGLSSYTGGVYSSCPNFATSYSQINHAVVVVGMDANRNYIIKNSWGTGWGQSGYGTISSNPASNCAITAFVFQMSWGYQLFGSTLLFLLALIFVLQ